MIMQDGGHRTTVTDLAGPAVNTGELGAIGATSKGKSQGKGDWSPHSDVRMSTPQVAQRGKGDWTPHGSNVRTSHAPSPAKEPTFWSKSSQGGRKGQDIGMLSKQNTSWSNDAPAEASPSQGGSSMKPFWMPSLKAGTLLPHGWRRLRDANTDRDYYHNKTLAQTQWERPYATSSAQGHEQYAPMPATADVAMQPAEVYAPTEIG